MDEAPNALEDPRSLVGDDDDYDNDGDVGGDDSAIFSLTWGTFYSGHDMEWTTTTTTTTCKALRHTPARQRRCARVNDSRAHIADFMSLDSRPICFGLSDSSIWRNYVVGINCR